MTALVAWNIFFIFFCRLHNPLSSVLTPSPFPDPQTSTSSSQTLSHLGTLAQAPSTRRNEYFNQTVSEAPTLEQNHPNVFSMRNSPAGSYFSSLWNFATSRVVQRALAPCCLCKTVPTSRQLHPNTAVSGDLSSGSIYLYLKGPWQMTNHKQQVSVL